MSPPLLGVEEEGQSNASVVASSGSMDCLSQSGSGLKERNYLGLSDCSSVESSTITSLSKENKKNLNLKATELRLGLPGSQSPQRDPDLSVLKSGLLDEKLLFPLLPSKDGICASSQKTIVSGNKRGFSDTMDAFPEMKNSGYTEGNWIFHASGSESESPQSVGQGMFPANSTINVMLSSRSSGGQPAAINKEVPPKAPQEHPRAANGSNHNQITINNNSSPPAAK